MSSIRTVQTERVMENVVRILYSQGEKPMLNEITTRIARYFSEYPAGRPLPMAMKDLVQGIVSDPRSYNKLLRHVALNIDVLYEASLRQVQDVMLLTASMQDDLARLEQKRKRIEGRIDDYLLAQYNTDGYFYSVSDNFSDLSMTNLSLTSAEVNTDVGEVILPTISTTTTRLPANKITVSSINVKASEEEAEYATLAPFIGALQNSLDNILWAIEVETKEIEEVITTIDLLLGDEDPVVISRVDLNPYGVLPVQAWIETLTDSSWQVFGGSINTSSTKMIFGDTAKAVRRLRIHLRKTKPDHSDVRNGITYYKYIFGAKEISFLYQVYERDAQFVSSPLQIPSDFEGDMTIDAVSIDIKDSVPSDCDIKYYVAPTNFSEFEGDEDFVPNIDISTYTWSEIAPIGSAGTGPKVIRFDGASLLSRKITPSPDAGDMELIPRKFFGPIQERNPTPSIIPGVDIYKIAEIEDEPFINSLRLYEGLNTTRIYSRNLDSSLLFNDMSIEYWADIFKNDAGSLTLDYGSTDSGNEFFYGGDVGAVGKDVYVETFLGSDKSWETFLSEFQKVDPRSKTWDVKVFLNGRILGHLPVGTNKMQLPWNLNRGMNHIVLLIRIPFTDAISDAFMGALSLMGRNRLSNYGLVFLDEWNYVDMFTMKYNEIGQPKTFTINEGHIISRREPTSDFRIQYASNTGVGPQAVILRADLSRSRNNPTVSPGLREYRLRFSYEEGI